MCAGKGVMDEQLYYDRYAFYSMDEPTTRRMLTAKPSFTSESLF